MAWVGRFSGGPRDDLSRLPPAQANLPREVDRRPSTPWGASGLGLRESFGPAYWVGVTHSAAGACELRCTGWKTAKGAGEGCRGRQRASFRERSLPSRAVCCHGGAPGTAWSPLRACTGTNLKEDSIRKAH